MSLFVGGFVSGRPGRYALLRITVILGLLAGFALSPKLWLISRLYPLTPVWSFLRPLSSPGDYIVFFALIALLIASIFAPRRAILMTVFAPLALLAFQDQPRWQPWFYQYVLMLLAIALAGSSRPAAALNTCCLIVAAIYIWSGLAKLNPRFAADVFPSLVSPFLGAGPVPAEWPVQRLAFLAPLVECGVGAGLLIKRFRRAACFGAIAMHVFILLAIGPLGTRFNTVVWPWNLATIAFLLLLFFRRAEDPEFQDIVWGRAFAFQKIVLVLFALMPALSFFNLWDHDLSSALYSGNRNSAAVYFSDDVFERLPEEIQNLTTDEGPNWNGLDIDEWSFAEMNVPSYPETRIFKNVARRICGYAVEGSAVELVVEGQLALVDSHRRSVYRCSDLDRNGR
jgi:hypothetical protein